MPTKTSLILADRPLVVLPKLAAAIGLEQAIIVQQLHYLLSHPGNGRLVNGRRWVFNTYAQWRAQYFPFWSERTIRRAFCGLEEKELISSCQPDGTLSRRKYYRVDEEGVRRLSHAMAQMTKSANLAASSRTDGPLPLTETSYREDYSLKATLEGVTTPDGGARTISEENQPGLPERGYGVFWIPDKRSKEEKLRALKPPKNYPSEREFDAFLETSDSVALEYRPDLYSTLCDHKWRHWDKVHNRWVRIRNWKAYVLALNGLIGARRVIAKRT